MRRLALANQNMSKFLRVIPGSWKTHPIYHELKPLKTPNVYKSYRTMGLSTLELRIAEELWTQEAEPLLRTAAGEEQMARDGAQLITYINVETGLIRSELDLPAAVMGTDLAEAFGTSHPATITVAMHEVAN